MFMCLSPLKSANIGAHEQAWTLLRIENRGSSKSFSFAKGFKTETTETNIHRSALNLITNDLERSMHRQESIQYLSPSRL